MLAVGAELAEPRRRPHWKMRLASGLVRSHLLASVKRLVVSLARRLKQQAGAVYGESAVARGQRAAEQLIEAIARLLVDRLVEGCRKRERERDMQLTVG